MLKGLYTATAGMMTQQRKHDTVSNNIANLNTPGYKQVNQVNRAFPEMLISLMSGENNEIKKVGKLHTGVFAEENFAIFQQGDLMETTNRSDFAIRSDIQIPGITFNEAGIGTNAAGETVFQPQALFTVETQNGELRYTRNGKFTVNENGELMTFDGYKVLGRDNEPIVLQGIALNDITVLENGSLIRGSTGQAIAGPNGQPLQLLISRVDDPYKLIRDGNGSYRLEDDNLARPVEQTDRFSVHQGFVERSNVDPAQSTIDMMTALRAYEANQKVIQFYDKSLEKAVNEVGRV